MNFTRKLLAIGATAIGFGGVGAVAAVAQTSTTTRPAVVTPAPSDHTDTLQQGDQTIPDVPGAAETTGPSEKPATSETEAANDGTGGHQDPPGNVDHQFDGRE
jgi:hypothetical protein